MLTTDGSPPPFQRGGMGDHNAGVSAAAAISAALYAREKTGEGQLVSTSLLRQGIYTLSFDLSLALRFGVPLQVADRRTMANPAINSYRDSEGRWFWLIGLEGERHWPHLARVVGHPEWIEDPRFATPAERASNAGELIAILDEIFATKTREEWGKLFDAEGEMWWAPVQTIDEVIADPQVRAAGALVEVPDGPTTTTFPATPVDFESPCEPRWMAPEHGQHTDEVLSELGRTPEQIAALRDRGLVT
jgi:crotonobetainyl-CoA:carnitine CoA-transferase CaiB-like acyl-CoA transferase